MTSSKQLDELLVGSESQERGPCASRPANPMCVQS
jgi:hypothetical protein